MSKEITFTCNVCECPETDPNEIFEMVMNDGKAGIALIQRVDAPQSMASDKDRHICRSCIRSIRSRNAIKDCACEQK